MMPMGGKQHKTGEGAEGKRGGKKEEGGEEERSAKKFVSTSPIAADMHTPTLSTVNSVRSVYFNGQLVDPERMLLSKKYIPLFGRV